MAAQTAGTWNDLTVLQGRVLHVFTTANGEITEEFVDNGEVRKTYNLGRWPLFLRCSASTEDHVLVAGKAWDNGDAIFSIDGGTPISLGPCHGIHCVSLGSQDDGTWILWVTRQHSLDTYLINKFGTHELLDQKPLNSSQGLLWLNALADVYRDAVPGLVYPYFAGPGSPLQLYVGQNSDAEPARLRVAEHPNGRSATLVDGYFQRPQALLHRDVLYYCAYGQYGSEVNFHRLDRIPWGNDTATLPDIPWTPDPTKRVDMTPALEAASTAYKDLGNGRGIYWLKKSPERDDWGEWWYVDHSTGHVGLLEDRSTGTRMVSYMRFPEGWDGFNTKRARLSPERIQELNAQGYDLGDPLTLPLASYTWDRSSLWMPLTFLGKASFKQTVAYHWWDLPEFGGTWEVHVYPLVMEAEAGYARINGREVFARTRYGKADGTSEWNYWGPTGWVAFSDVEDSSGKPIVFTPGPGPAAKGPYVESRFTPQFPIYRPTVEPPKPKPPVKDPVITYDDLKNLEGRLEDTYWNHGHHPERTVRTHVDEGGEVWRQVYFSLRQTKDHESAIRAIESQIDVIEGRPDRWAPVTPPPPTGSTIRPIEGVLRAEGKWWADNTGLINPVGISALYALRPGTFPISFLDFVRGFVQFVRVFAGPLATVDGRPGQSPGDVYRALPELMAAAQARNLWVQAVAITDTGKVGYDWSSHVKTIAGILKRFPNSILAITNEMFHSFQAPTFTIEVARKLVQVARDEGFTGPITIGTHLKQGSNNARQDEIDPGTGTYYATGGSFNAVALARGLDPWYREVCRLRESELIRDVHRQPVEQTESNRVEETGNPRGFAFCLGFLGGGFGLSTVFHSSQARECLPLTGIQQEAFQAFQQGVSLSRGNWVFKNARWSDSPIRNASFVEGEGVLPGANLWRTYSFLKGNEGLVLLTGPDPNNGTIQWQNGWEPYDKIDAYGAIVLKIRQK